MQSHFLVKINPRSSISSNNFVIQLIWIFVPIQKKQNITKKNYQLNSNEKFVDKAQQCLAPFTHQAELAQKFKLAVWQSYSMKQNYEQFIFIYKVYDTIRMNYQMLNIWFI